MIKDSFGGIEELSTKVRNQIRKSFKTYDIKRISSDEMLRVGYPVFLAALKSYKVKAKIISELDFVDSIKKGSLKGNIDYWAVYDKKTGQVVAVAINTLHGDCCEYNTMKADPQYLNSTYPYYGLIFEMNRYYLDELKLLYVNDGAKSITNHSNIQTFLIDKFNFRKAYCRVQIVYQWWFKLMVVLLYPFRSLIPVLKIRAILNIEEIRRKMDYL
ncbi:hypothetical protein [Butyricimonas faecihominis]|uniref:hypothetical protein n=1 Tax=Butyricimonas faecihominis TaxID=1472416 RepID=UPI0022E03D6B|nr:hypothetical protein [Butyricimonas faecihominis]